MDLKTRIADDMKSAMRERATVRLETIRMARAAIQRKELDDRSTLDDSGVLQVLQKMVKQGQDSITQFEAGNRTDLADKERVSVEILSAYLPKALSDEALDQMIEEVMTATGASGMRDMGKVMGMLKPMIEGRADMGALSGRIKQKLSD
jgi:uncharacterized protein